MLQHPHALLGVSHHHSISNTQQQTMRDDTLNLLNLLRYLVVLQGSGSGKATACQRRNGGTS